MTKLRNGSQVATRPARKTTAGTAGYFSESNDSSEPSYPGQDWFNDVIDEIAQAVTAAGVTYDPTKITNLKSTVEALRNANNLNAGTVDKERLGGVYDISIESDAGAFRTDANSLYITNNVSETGRRLGDGAASRIWLDRSAGKLLIQTAAYDGAASVINWNTALSIHADGSVDQLIALSDTVDSLSEPNNAAIKTAMNASGNAPLYAARAWCIFDGTTASPTVLESQNISSVAKLAAGAYKINLIDPMPTQNYSVAGSVQLSELDVINADGLFSLRRAPNSMTADGFFISVGTVVTGSPTSGNLIDAQRVCISVFG